MFFLPSDEFWYLTIVRLKVSFDDTRTGVGTGFFVYGEKTYFLVIARHVIDPKYCPEGAYSQPILSRMDLTLQYAVNSGPSTENSRITNKVVSH